MQVRYLPIPPQRPLCGRWRVTSKSTLRQIAHHDENKVGAYAGKCSKAATRSPKLRAVGSIPNCLRQTGKRSRKREKLSIKWRTWWLVKRRSAAGYMQSEAGEPGGSVLS